MTVCHTEEAIKPSAITTRATKFIALIRPLHFDTKIPTWALNYLFVGKDILQSRFERNFFESGNLICSGKGLYNINKQFEFLKCRHIPAIVSLWKYCHSHSFSRVNFRTRFKHAHSLCRCVARDTYSLINVLTLVLQNECACSERLALLGSEWIGVDS